MEKTREALFFNNTKSRPQSAGALPKRPTSASSGAPRSDRLSKQMALLEIKTEQDIPPDQQKNNAILMGIFQASEKAEAELHTKLGDTVFNAAPKLERTLRRNAEKEATMKLLSRIEQRTKALDVVTSDENRDHKTASRALIDDSKTRARENYLTFLQAQKVDDVKIDAQKEIERITKEHQRQLEEVTTERDQLKFRTARAEQDLIAVREELQSLQYAHSLLKQKLQKITARDAENQKELKFFSKMHPIFNELQEKLNVDSAQEIVQRMESLERQQVDSYSQLLEVQEQKNSMEREVEQMRKETEMLVKARVVDLTSNLEKSERKRKDLEQAVGSLERQLKRADDYKKQFLTLNFAVHDLYNMWERGNEDPAPAQGTKRGKQSQTPTAAGGGGVSSFGGGAGGGGGSSERTIGGAGDASGGDALDGGMGDGDDLLGMIDRIDRMTSSMRAPSMDSAIQLISKLKEIMIESSPNRAGRAYRELSGIANTLWTQHFSEDAGLKSKPREIFERAVQLLQQKDEEIRFLKKKLSAAEHAGLVTKIEIEKSKQEARALQVQFSKMRSFTSSSSLIRESGGATTSQSARPLSATTTRSQSRPSSAPAWRKTLTKPGTADSAATATINSFFVTQQTGS